MNEDNVTFLKKNLTNMGFDDKTLHANLETQVKQQQPEFTLSATGEYKRGSTLEKMDYVLAFRKSDSSERYFFNSYQATLRNDDASKEVSRNFYLTKGRGFTAKEAFNLLSGRAVNKDMVNKSDEPYNAWIKVNFMERDEHNNYKLKQFGEKYGYDLQKTLQNFPIRELADPELRERITASLEKGNTVKVTFNREGKDEVMHIEANPQYKTLNVYNESMKKVFTDNGKKTQKEETEKTKENKESQGESVSKGADEEDTGKKTGRRRGVGV